MLDHDGDGFISPTDLDVFNTQYTGTCSLLATDFLAIAKMLNLKRKNVNYLAQLTRVPTQTISNRMSKRSPAYNNTATSNSPQKSSSPLMRKQSKLNVDNGMKISPEPTMQKLSSIYSTISEEPASSLFKRKNMGDRNHENL